MLREYSGGGSSSCPAAEVPHGWKKFVYAGTPRGCLINLADDKSLDARVKILYVSCPVKFLMWLLSMVVDSCCVAGILLL